MDYTRHQEILDRCWEALPEGCPMRQWDKKLFDELWGHWDPRALARVDPTCAIPESLLYVEVFAEEPDVDARKAHKVWIAEHYLWLLFSGTEVAFNEWNNTAMKCRKNADSPDCALITFIEYAMEYPTGRVELVIEPGGGSIENEEWIQDTKKQIKEELKGRYPNLFPPLDDPDAWRALINNAKKHLGEIPNCNAGRPKN